VPERGAWLKRSALLTASIWLCDIRATTVRLPGVRSNIGQPRTMRMRTACLRADHYGAQWIDGGSDRVSEVLLGLRLGAWVRPTDRSHAQ
jgi:hypothetical protein